MLFGLIDKAHTQLFATGQALPQLLLKSLETDTTKCRNASDYVLRLSLEMNAKLKE